MTKSAIENWMDAIPEGYRFAFIVVTKEKDSEHTELFCRRLTNGTTEEILNDYTECINALKQSNREFLKEALLTHLKQLCSEEED